MTREGTMGEQSPEKGLIESLKILWLPVAGLIGAIILVVEFIELWKGDQATVTRVVAGFALVILLFSLIKIGFGKEKIDNKLLAPSGYYSHQPRYPKFYKFGRIGLLVIILLAVFLSYSLHSRIKELDNKFVVLIANFDGPAQSNYRITEELIAKLQLSFQFDENIIIVPLDRVITEQQGSKFAREEGDKRLADIVIWGWYGITDTDTILTVHIENMGQSKLIPLPSSELSQTQASSEDLQTYTIQRNLAKQMTSLIEGIMGVIYYEAGDKNNALEWLSKALIDKETLIISKADILLYRGNTYIDLGRYEEAISDYSQSIQTNPDNVVNYINRGTAYYEIGQYDQAINDYSKALEIDPTNPIIYYDRGNSNLALRNCKLAIIDFNKAIEFNSEYVLAFVGRGACYIYLGEYENAFPDLDKAIQLDPQNAAAYMSRGIAYYSVFQYEQAIVDYDRAIELDPMQPKAYTNRGVARAAMRKYEEAIIDSVDEDFGSLV